MARMKQLAPRGRSLAMRGRVVFGGGTVAVRSRDRIDTWRKWYNTREWRDLRWSVLVAALFTCRRCGTVGDSPVMVADHVTPHRGDRTLFFDRANLQCLCAHCHNSDKQREERRDAYRHD